MPKMWFEVKVSGVPPQADSGVRPTIRNPDT